MPSRIHRIFKPILPQAMLITSMGGGMLIGVDAVAQASSVQAVQQLEYNIPAANLDKVLNNFAVTAGIHLAIDGSLTRGLNSSGLKGSFSIDAGLSRILSGTGLLAVKQADGGYILKKRVKGNVFTMPTVTVIGQVQGTKLVGTTQEVEVSVEVFDSDRLDRERLVELSDVFAKTPNMTSDGLANAARISIRGISRTGSTGRGETINFYVDGAPISSLSLQDDISMWDVEQAEVLRGSQSSVQGRNALAGAVVINTADPTFEPEVKVRLTEARFNTTQAAMAVSGPLLEDQLAGRLAIDYQQGEGFIENLNSQSAGKDKTVRARGKLLFLPEGLPGFETKLTIEHAKTDADIANVTGIDIPISDPGFADVDFFDYETNSTPRVTDNRSIRIVSESDYEFNDNWLLKAILTHEDAENRFRRIPDASQPDGELSSDNRFDSRVNSLELRAQFDFDNARGLFGAYYFESESADSSVASSSLTFRVPDSIRPLVSFNPSDSQVILNIDSKSEVENYALFGQLEWDVSEQVTLSAGLRYDRESFNDPASTTTVRVAPANCLATAPGALLGLPVPSVTIPCQTFADQLTGAAEPVAAAPDESFDAWLPRLGVTYQYAEEHSVSLSYQRGYRAGGATFAVIDNPNGPGRIRTTLPYDPEYLDTVEFSSRNLFLDEKLLANANVFYSKYKDQQITVNSDDPQDPINSRIENAAETTLYGAEFMLDYTPSNEWNVYASVGLLKTEINEFEFARQGRYANLKGNELRNAPKLTYTLGASYQNENGFFASAAYSYIGEQFSSEANLDSNDFRQAFADAGLNPNDGAKYTQVIKSRANLTMRAGYDFKNGFSIYAFGSNLLDDENLNWIRYADVNTNTGQLDFGGSPGAVPNKPRSLGVGIDLNY